ncbi:helix-turn-helix domain-containing protein [Streptomyces jumonjinensis]|uniref:helix-turn-helix domain-containing protein n=1 Tax=Streptomyces jumonjinensis TaxID=1945 RepID=UPI0037997477
MNRDPKAWARLGKALAAARTAQGLIQSSLAERAGVSLGSVQSAESGTVPKARMPYTIGAIAAALGWPNDAVGIILDGGAPPEGWTDAPAPQGAIKAERVETILTAAMVRATSTSTAAEIRAATKIALDALRKEGLLFETDDMQPE